MASTNKETESKLNGHAFSSSDKNSMSNAIKSIETQASEVSAKATSILKSTQTYVEDHPLRSICYAAVAGLAIGNLTAMIRRPRH